MKETVEIFIWKDGGEHGPFSPAALAGSIRLGSIRPETPAWTRADPTWRTAASILKHIPEPQATPHPASRAPVSQPLRQDAFNPPHAPASPNGGEASLKIGLAAAAVVGILLIVLLARPSGTGSAIPTTRAEERIEADRGSDGEDAEISPTPSTNVRRAVSIDEAEKCVLMARCEDGSGTAFIATVGGKQYVYTNVHVASLKGIGFTDFRGRTVSVSQQGQVVGKPDKPNEEPGIDIVRFPLLESPEYSLGFATREAIEKRPEVWTLGDSGGERVLKTLRGHIKGVGPAKIEVDCEFIQGNSGGPIVTSRGEVVGIASYMTTDRSIWAKGTEQEIRRMAWIPGREHVWVATSFDELAEERSLVEGCEVTSGLLWVISQLKTAQDGFHKPDDFSADAENFLAMPSDHPLRSGLEEIGKTLAGKVQSGSVTNHTQHREFVRFFESCSAYQESQLEKAEDRTRSSFWRNRLDGMMQAHQNLLQRFRECLERYRNDGQLGEALEDA